MKSLWAKQTVIPNEAWVEAENVADLRANRWLVVARRAVEQNGDWQYVTGIKDDLDLFKRMRELEMLAMTQRRDGVMWTLLAKVAQAKAGEWARTLERETSKRRTIQ